MAALFIIGKTWKQSRWSNLECILPGEGNQYEKIKYYMIPTIWHSEMAKL